MQLESGKYREAISLLNDYLQRNPNDTEAHNLLARCFYELGLYEQTSQYLQELKKTFPAIKCFHTNYCLSILSGNENPDVNEDSVNGSPDIFIKYYVSLFSKNLKCWGEKSGPALTSKLFFREYRFEKIGSSENTVEININKTGQKYLFKDKIITIGRYGYLGNTIPYFTDTSISRLHFLIVNSKNDVWLYNLSQLGTFVDGEAIKKKKFLHGLHHMKSGIYEFTIKTDEELLL
jgi:tetratricopeptide (TPR) repeat protein